MAIKNVSTAEKTVKSMYSLMSADNYTIDKTILYCSYNKFNMDIQFGNILDDYRDYFEKYCEDIEVPKKFYYQPAAFSEYYYGTPDLDFLVLYFAKMLSLFEFNKPVVHILPKSRLIEINRLFVEYKSEVEASYRSPTKYIEEI